jgi:hypothetical protein
MRPTFLTPSAESGLFGLGLHYTYFLLNPLSQTGYSTISACAPTMSLLELFSRRNHIQISCIEFLRI